MTQQWRFTGEKDENNNSAYIHNYLVSSYVSVSKDTYCNNNTLITIYSFQT